MSDTPLTDAIAFEMDGHEFCDAKHAREMERDRAMLIRALRWYAKANGLSLLGDAGLMARTAIFEVEESK
jgi:hypothetical protein